MKTISLTIGTVEESTPWRETRGILNAVHAEISPGRFVNVTLGQAGVMIFRGTEHVLGIPLAEILRLAGEVDAELAPDSTPPEPVERPAFNQP